MWKYFFHLFAVMTMTIFLVLIVIQNGCSFDRILVDKNKSSYLKYLNSSVFIDEAKALLPFLLSYLQ